MKKFNAFTLAEVLVTVGIIGVVSALTVPNIIHNYQQDAYTVKLRKVINEIESAIDMFITEEAKSSLATTSANTTAGFNDFIEAKFKIVKTCATGSPAGCFANESYMSIGGSSDAFSCSGKSYLLADGAAICATRTSDSPLVFTLNIDTNGTQPPNIGGRDMFQVYVNSQGIIYNETPTADESGNTVTCATSAFGDQCLEALQNNNWKMNY